LKLAKIFKKRFKLKIAKIYPTEKEIVKNFTETEIGSDKSISHRSAMFALLANGKSEVSNFLEAEDTQNSLKIVEKLGAKVERVGEKIFITSDGVVREPDDVLDCGNSGTGMRLFAGLLSPHRGSFVLTGDKYLRRRPMKRVTKPLKEIGAFLDGRNDGELAPLFIRGGKVTNFNYNSKIASAQVKSALILSALFGNRESKYSEPELSRDHTERMLNGMGAEIERISETEIKIKPIQKPLEPLVIEVPTDPSSAFFFAVATAIVPNSKIILKNMLLNKTRIEAYKVLQKMGTKIEFIEKSSKYESIGEIHIEYAPLKGVEVSENISWLIDEIPALAIAMSVADGESLIKNAEELRVKESDRIDAVVKNLKFCDVNVEEFSDGFKIVGGKLEPAVIDSFGDHRIAMSFAIGGLLVGMKIEDIESVNTSFPNFFEILSQFTKVELD
jgi:3-phosphoshikimate 1-carboxyvinyltransferase